MQIKQKIKKVKHWNSYHTLKNSYDLFKCCVCVCVCVYYIAVVPNLFGTRDLFQHSFSMDRGGGGAGDIVSHGEQ